MKIKLFTMLLIATSYAATAQTISIPDPIFEQILINKEIDSDGIVNGQILTADALAVTTLIVESPDPTSGEYIENLTGIEGFINIENLTVNNTKAQNINLNNLTKLKYLDCVQNAFSNLNVSNNSLLEYLDITSIGDVFPFNSIYNIDLSQNPNFKKLIAIGPISYINLKNGANNNAIELNISNIVTGGNTPIRNVCIEVDNVTAAQNNQSPYSEWIITNNNKTYSFSENCTLSADKFNKNSIIIYPNPATDVLHITTANGTTIDKAVLYDLSGRLVKEYENSTDSLSVSGLEKGIYMLQVFSENHSYSQKVVIN